jgi:hypothetical protein
MVDQFNLNPDLLNPGLFKRARQHKSELDRQGVEAFVQSLREAEVRRQKQWEREHQGDPEYKRLLADPAWKLLCEESERLEKARRRLSSQEYEKYRSQLWMGLTEVWSCYKIRCSPIPPSNPPPNGPGQPYQFWWDGKPYELEISPAAWQLLKAVWGSPKIALSGIGEKLSKGTHIRYDSLKTTVSRLNDAVRRAGLPFCWTKARKEDSLLFDCPPQ